MSLLLTFYTITITSGLIIQCLSKIIVAWFWGDPHCMTLDGLQYTCNILSEVWMVQSPASTQATFELQGRTVRAWDENLSFSPHGTVWGGFAARAFYEEGNETVSSARVEIQMTDDRTTGCVKKACNSFAWIPKSSCNSLASHEWTV